MAYLLAALVGGVLLFNSQATPRKAEKIAEAALQKRFPGAVVDVSIQGKRGFDVLNGKFSSVRVALTKFGALTELPLQMTPRVKNRGRVGLLELQLRDFTWNDLKVDAADLAFRDVVFDRDLLKKEGRINVVSCGPATAHLTIPATSLEGMMRTRLKDVQEARLTLQNGQLRVTGKRPAPLVGVLVPFTLVADLKPRNGGEIWLIEPQVTAGGVPLPATLTESLLGDVNPIYVFDRRKKWPFRVNLTSIQTSTNKLEIKGSLTFVPATPSP